MEATYEVLTKDKKIRIIKMWFSDNPPYEEDAAGCIGYDVYDENLEIIDGGEMDYFEDEDVPIQHFRKDIFEFAEIEAKSFTEIEYKK